MAQEQAGVGNKSRKDYVFRYCKRRAIMVFHGRSHVQIADRIKSDGCVALPRFGFTLQQAHAFKKRDLPGVEKFPDSF